MGIGALTGVAIAVVAATRFWAVVVALFVVRASLDALKLGSFGNTTNALDPSVIVGLAFLLSGSMWLFAQWRSGPWYKPSRTTCWFAALSIAGVFSAVGSDNPVQSAQVGLKVCAGALMFAVLEQAYRQRPERCRHILAAGAASLIVPALVAFSQSRAGKVEQYLEVSRIRGTFVHANPFATYLVILAVVAVAVRPHLRGRARLAATAVMGTAGALTLFTYARGAWVALILGLVVIGVKQDRRILAGLLAVVVLVVVAVPSVTARLSDLSEERVEGRGDPNSLAWRFGYWGRLLPEVADSPVTGIGLEQVLAHSEEGLQPHNVFVQTVVEAGLFGLTCLVGLCFAMASDLRRAIRNASPGLHRGIAVGAAAAALGVLAQLLSENLLTQAAIHWYLAAPVAFAIACSTTAPPTKPAPLPTPTEP
jgi:O-antigen ligase